MGDTAVDDMMLLFSFNCADADNVDVALVWFFDFFRRPLSPFRWIVLKKERALMKGEQFVEITGVNAPAAHIRRVVDTCDIAPLSSFGITQDFTHTIVNEHFKLASAGMNPP